MKENTMAPSKKVISFISICLVISYASSSNTHEDYLNSLQYQNSIFDPHRIYTPQIPYYSTILESSSEYWLPQSHNSYHEDFLNCLQSQNSIFDHHRIYSPQTPNYTTIYENSAGNWLPLSHNSSLRPEYIITPLFESEIQTTILCSKKVGLLIKVRSGGHDYECLSYISQVPFVMLDLINFRPISIDTDKKTAWIGAGSTLGEVYHAISEQSDTLALVGGTCPSVGVGGHFSGGGYGMMSRNFGLAADNIIDAKIIDVNGQVMDRNAMGEDLFWAIRGGGGASFGVIAAYKVKLVTVPEKVTVFEVIRTSEQNATELVQMWQSIGNTIDQKLLLRLYIRSISSTTTPGKRTISVSFTSMYIGGVEDLLQIMQKNFPELGIVKEDCIEMKWIDSILYNWFYKGENSTEILLDRKAPGQFFKGKSDYVTSPISKEGLEGIWERLHQDESGTAMVQFSPYGGKMAEISESEIPFPHRKGILFMLHYSLDWKKAEDSEKHVNWIRELYSYMAAHVSKSPRRAFWNYRDLDLGSNNIVGRTSYNQARKWALSYFNHNFDRLLYVKGKVDPSNFFRDEQSIPSL